MRTPTREEGRGSIGVMLALRARPGFTTDAHGYTRIGVLAYTANERSSGIRIIRVSP